MSLLNLLLSASVILTAVLARLPFRNFPLDDDFSIYTYRARFASRGFQWKKDLQIIGVPIWKMLLIDRIYGAPRGGIQRLRWLQTCVHAVGALTIYITVFSLTRNPWAAGTAGILYAFYGTSPDMTAGSFNHEQFYIPFIFLGLTLLWNGPQNVFWSGLCFGAATIPKYPAGLYGVVLMGLVGYEYGLEPMTQFVLAAATPFLLSHLTDWRLGFLDRESKQQMDTRMATTLRNVRTKRMYFSMAREIGLIIKQTLPVWIAGVPALAVATIWANNLWLTAFTLVTLCAIVAQRAFSRYHYLPWIALLSAASGLELDLIMHTNDASALGFAGVFALTLIWNLSYLRDFYLRPTAPQTLRRYEKFDQYLYLPRLGKILKRLMRMRREKPERLFVWGTFSQLYHLTEVPASDNYLHYSIGPWDTPALEGFYDTVIGGLVRHKPLYLIKTFPDLDMDYLEQITGLHYRLLKVAFARFPVYRLEAMVSVAKNPLTLPLAEKMRVMEQLTNNPRHVPGICRDDFERNRADIALRECRKLLRMNPGDTDGLAYLADTLAFMERPAESASCYQTILNLEPFRQGTRIGLAAQNIKLNRFEEALFLLDEEVRRFEDDTEISYLRAKIHRHYQQHQETANALDTVRAVSPGRVDSWEWEIEALGQLQNVSRLKDLYRDAERIEDQKDRQWVKTRIVSELARVETAIRPEHETFAFYLQEDPENSLMQYAQASALEKENHRDAACRLFRQIASHPENYAHIRANAWFRVARLLPENQRSEAARHCLALNPDHQGALGLLADPVYANTPATPGV